MPIYEYECRACERGFEQLVRSFDSDEEITCPHCKSRKVQRRLSLFAAHQGTGGGGSMPPTPCARCGDMGSCAMSPGY